MELVKLPTKGTDKYSYTCSTGNVSQLLHAAAPLRHMSVLGIHSCMVLVCEGDSSVLRYGYTKRGNSALRK